MELVQQKWNEILEAVQKEYQIQDISYKTWIKPLKIDHIENNTIYILTQEDSDLGINFIRKKYEKPLLVTIAEITGQEYNLEFLVIGAATQTAQQEVKVNKSSNLNPKYTFDSFVVGNNNKFAHRAALAVAETPGKAYNPLYIYGGPGLGKTHLMHAIGNYILQENPEKKVIYVTSEEFLNEVIESIRSTNNTTAMTKFRNKYRKVDVLMIDDIQFIIGK